MGQWHFMFTVFRYRLYPYVVTPPKSTTNLPLVVSLTTACLNPVEGLFFLNFSNRFIFVSVVVVALLTLFFVIYLNVKKPGIFFASIFFFIFISFYNFARMQIRFASQIWNNCEVGFRKIAVTK